MVSALQQRFMIDNALLEKTSRSVELTYMCFYIIKDVPEMQQKQLKYNKELQRFNYIRSDGANYPNVGKFTQGMHHELGCGMGQHMPCKSPFLLIGIT